MGGGDGVGQTQFHGSLASWWVTKQDERSQDTTLIVVPLETAR